jgi:hypothetical protein
MIRVRGCDLTVDEASELADRLEARHGGQRDMSLVNTLRRRVAAGGGGLPLDTYEAAAVADVVSAWVAAVGVDGVDVDRLERLHETASKAAQPR